MKNLRSSITNVTNHPTSAVVGDTLSDFLQLYALNAQAMNRTLKTLRRRYEAAVRMEEVAQARKDDRNARRRAKYLERKIAAWTMDHEEEVERLRSGACAWNDAEDYWESCRNEF